jgi:hypothetical protein
MLNVLIGEGVILNAVKNLGPREQTRHESEMVR